MVVLHWPPCLATHMSLIPGDVLIISYYKSQIISMVVFGVCFKWFLVYLISNWPAIGNVTNILAINDKPNWLCDRLGCLIMAAIIWSRFWGYQLVFSWGGGVHENVTWPLWCMTSQFCCHDTICLYTMASSWSHQDSASFVLRHHNMYHLYIVTITCLLQLLVLYPYTSMWDEVMCFVMLLQLRTSECPYSHEGEEEPLDLSRIVWSDFF